MKIASAARVSIVPCIAALAIDGRCLACSLSLQPTLGIHEPQAVALATPEAAQAAAKQLVGVSPRDNWSAAATLEHGGRGADVPFLQEGLANAEIWHIVLSGGHLTLASTPSGVTDKFDRIFDVYLDASTGSLAKVISRWPAGFPIGLPPAGAESAAERMSNSDREAWTALGPDTPSTTLMQAIDEVQRQGGGALGAAQIEAYCVMMSRLQHPEPRAVWSVHLYGLRPMETSLPRGARPVSVHSRNHMRYVVDDQTSKLLYMTTTPQPDIPDGWTYDAEADTFLLPDGSTVGGNDRRGDLGEREKGKEEDR